VDFWTEQPNMTSAVPTKRQQKPNSLPSGQGALVSILPIIRTSVGAKFLIALTGLGLTGFVIAHMVGNLQIFLGQGKLNYYAKALKDLGPLLWIARLGLLALLVLHVVLSIRLTLRARRARPIPYVHEQTIQASTASRTMIWTGLVILIFLFYHLAHYTFGWIGTALVNGHRVAYLDLQHNGLHDVYSMTILGFMNPIVGALYIAAQVVLITHLSHGVSSVFQTLGANSPRWQAAIRTLSFAIAWFVGLGNIAIVLAVWLGLLELPAGIVPG
jgi:succinate dehydrogenase / fumarate reductase cytochrome b subunit